MITLIKTIGVLIILMPITACLGDQKTNDSQNTKDDGVKDVEIVKTSSVDIEKIKNMLCDEFPKDLVLKYNPDATHIDIESIDNGSGGILHCNIKLFYGEKEYEFWKGQVSANINQQQDPFWQYNPERNATLYQKVDALGERAVYISNMYQLQILKNGVLYMITPPNNGNRTSSGKENKEIAIEIANHYNL